VKISLIGRAKGMPGSYEKREEKKNFYNLNLTL
jgi:hypothetical protein